MGKKMMMTEKSINEVTVEDLIEAGLSLEEAQTLYKAVSDIVGLCGGHPPEVWREVVARRLLRPEHPHSLHQLIYYSVYSAWDSTLRGPPLYWFPSPYESRYTNLGRIMETHGPRLLGKSYKDPISSFSLFQQFSAHNPQVSAPNTSTLLLLGQMGRSVLVKIG